MSINPTGPPDSLGELLTMFHILRQQWPGARIVTGSLDDYLGQLMQAVDNKKVKLPVITGMETCPSVSFAS